MSAKPTTPNRPAATAAKPLAPEDVAPGDYVAVLDQVYEYPSVVWYCDRPLAGEDEVIRLRLRPHRSELPLRVVAVCVPFVYAEDVGGKRRTIDLRSTRLARIDRKVGKRVWAKPGARPSGKAKKRTRAK